MSATYRINNCEIPNNMKCVCGHTIQAHGSNGMICAGCHCKAFTVPEVPVAVK